MSNSLDFSGEVAQVSGPREIQNVTLSGTVFRLRAHPCVLVKVKKYVVGHPLVVDPNGECGAIRFPSDKWILKE